MCEEPPRPSCAFSIWPCDLGVEIPCGIIEFLGMVGGSMPILSN